MHNYKPRHFVIILIIFIVLAVFLFKKNDYSKLTYECDKIIISILTKIGIDTDKPTHEKRQPISAFKAKAEFLEKEFLISQDYQLVKIKDEIVNNNSLAKFTIGKIQSRRTKKEQSLTLEFYFKKLKLYRLILKKKIIRRKLAIVLDDWGYNKKTFKETLDLKFPITYSVLPNLAYSSEIADEASRLGHEVILHLPMEPHQANKISLEEKTILTTMGNEEIIKIVRENFANLPHLKGVNNHMGSKATEDEYVMGIVLDEIKNNNLYFLDSNVTSKSVGEKVAKEKGVPFLKRSIFLDNENDKESIKKQLFEAKRLAEINGQAIAVGHARHLTIITLKEIIPQIQKDNIELVYLSELLNNQKEHDNPRN